MEKFDQNIESLKERFQFSPSEKVLLDKIKKFEIISIASTIEGGFEKNSGKFNPYEKRNLFKVCIKYHEGDSSSAKILCLVPCKEIS